jgi:hypothetical protein
MTESASSQTVDPDRFAATDILWVKSGKTMSWALASNRYMLLIPGAAIGGQLTCYDNAMGPPEAVLAAQPHRVLVMGKDHNGSLAQLAVAARQAGRTVIGAFADWHFEKPHVRALAEAAHACVVQTAPMADAFARHYAIAPAIIEEPYEGIRLPPKTAFSPRIRLLWFGQAANLDGLEFGLKALCSGPLPPIQLVVVCNDPAAVSALLSRVRLGDGIAAEIHAWNPDTQQGALEWADFVFLPNLSTPEKAVKGHNRLTQALHAGRLALASPMPQYLEMADYCLTGDAFRGNLLWALANPDLAWARVHAGQAYIDTRFAPAIIGRKWAALIRRLMDEQQPLSPPA